MSYIQDALDQEKEPTYEDLELHRRQTKMKRDKLRRELDAYDQGQQEIEKQEARAANPQGYTLNGMPMRDPAGHLLLNPEDAAAQRLATDAYSQLQLLDRGAVDIDTGPQVTGYFEAPNAEREQEREGLLIDNTAKREALVDVKKKQMLSQLLRGRR